MLQEKFKYWRVILGSESPRRKELFQILNLPFNVRKKQVDESYPIHLKREEITNFLAKSKAEAFMPIPKNELIITSDTLVFLNNRPLGKPKNENDCFDMLSSLSGRGHSVITSVCFKSNRKEIVFYDETEIVFSKISDKEIRYYIRVFSPFDKAGGYGIQQWIGATKATEIHGSFYTVMGLPIHRVYEELIKFDTG